MHSPVFRTAVPGFFDRIPADRPNRTAYTNRLNASIGIFRGRSIVADELPLQVTSPKQAGIFFYFGLTGSGFKSQNLARNFF